MYVARLARLTNAPSIEISLKNYTIHRRIRENRPSDVKCGSSSSRRNEERETKRAISIIDIANTLFVVCTSLIIISLSIFCKPQRDLPLQQRESKPQIAKADKKQVAIFASDAKLRLNISPNCIIIALQ
jgi:hypothetical protein